MDSATSKCHGQRREFAIVHICIIHRRHAVIKNTSLLPLLQHKAEEEQL
jgi:hypothetical protein